MEQLSPWKLKAIAQHSLRLCRSFHYWTGKSLIEVCGPLAEQAQALFAAPFVVVSHGTEPDPILNYGNRQALELWEMDWDHFTATPSRCTAEPVEQSDRERLLAQAKSQGFISNYQGVRISSSGRRFSIQNVIIWDVLDEEERCCGQAATFHEWQFLS
jgi:hypothetical protein